MPDSELPDLSGITILAVDDDDDALYVLKTLLEVCRAVVLTASNAVEALSYLETTRVDVLISDFSMPFMNGIELIERVRKLPAHASTPAIMLTAFRKGLFGAHSAGFDVIMQKPLDIDSLAHGIAHLIARRRSGNQ